MEIEFLIVADAVEAINGKLYMLGGGWDKNYASAFPAPVRLGLAIGFLVDWDETNEQHQVRIAFLDEDGKEIMPEITGNFEVGRPPGLRAGAPQRAVMAINAGFPVPRAGAYEIKVHSAGHERSVGFESILAPGGPPR